MAASKFFWVFLMLAFAGISYASSVTFNVNQSTGADYNLSGINVDCNSGATYDLTNQTSPFTINFANGSYSCIFSKSEWDSNTATVVADVNKNVSLRLSKYVYPKIIQFTSTGATTSSTSLVTIQSWVYDANYGGATSVSIGCSFWASSGATAFDATWRIESSNDGIAWTNRGEITRTMSSNTQGGGVYLDGDAFNINDGNRFVRLRHQTSTALGSLTTNDVICHLRTNRDQNNFLMTTAVDSRGETTINATTYTNLGAAFTLNAPYNGFLYSVGHVTYRKIVANTSSESSFRMLENSAEFTGYPRFVSSDSSGVGAVAELFSDVNSAQVISSQYQGRSAISSTRFSFTVGKYFLSQKSGEYAQRSLLGVDNNSRDWNKIVCNTLTSTNSRDIEVVAVIPAKSSVTADLFEIYFNAKGSALSGYDVNSPVSKRSFPSADQNGIMIHQYLFTDVNSNDVNICIYGKSSLGKITFTGGNFLGVKANATTQVLNAIDTNSTIVISDLNLFEEGKLNTNVDLSVNSDVNVVFDFNAEGNSIDLNSTTIFYRAPYDDQNCFGVIRDTKQCGWKQESQANFFTAIQTDTNKYLFRSESHDDHSFKAWVYNADPDSFTTRDGNFELYGTNRWVKSLHTLVPRGPNYFYNFSFFAFPPSAGGDLIVYDCNNESLDPVTDPGCIIVDLAFNSPTELDSFYSIKYQTDDRNMVGNTVLNVDGNHWTYMQCPTCTVSDNWKIAYIAQNTNVDRARNWTTTAGLGLLTTSSSTHDFHYHYLISTQDNNAEWYVTLENQAGTTFTSPLYVEQINTANFPPISGVFNSPLSGTYYKSTLDLNWNVSDESDDLFCDFNIYGPEGNLVYFVAGIAAVNNNTICAVSGVNIINYASGIHQLRAKVTENNADFNFSSSSTTTFGVDNNAPVTAYSGCGSSWNNSSQTITLACSDVNGSGCNQSQYSINIGAWNNYATPFAINFDGNNRIDYNSNDVIGNIEGPRTSFCAIDMNAPRVGQGTLDNFSGVYNSGSQLYVKGPVDISADVNDLVDGISVSDTNQDACEYSLDAGANWTFGDYNSVTKKCIKKTIALTNAQQYTFRFRAKDNAGNLGIGTLSVSYIADSAAPVTIDNAPSGVVSASINVTLSSSDTGSDVNKIYYCVDEADTCNPSLGSVADGNNVIVAVNCPGSSCAKYLRYYALDNLGNTEVVKTSGAITFDNNVPNVGPTDINGFFVQSNHIKGTGNIIGGVVDDFDFNSLTSAYTTDGSNYTLCSEDANCYFTDENRLIKLGITIVDGQTYTFNTRIGHEADSNFGFGTPTIAYLGDYTPPTSSDNYDGQWHDSNVIITLSSNDLDANTYYCVDDTNTCTPQSIGTLVEVGCGAGSVCQTYLRYYSVDLLDNNEFGLGGARSTLVKIDKTKPNTSVNNSNTWSNTSPLNIALTCIDTGSGCATTEYKLDNNSLWTVGGSISIASDGNHFLEYRSVDSVGNTENTKSTYVAIDSTKPTFSIDNNNTWLSAVFNLLFLDTNFDVSGKFSAIARVNLGTWLDLNNSLSTFFTEINQDGNSQVDYNFTDNAGNSSFGTTNALLDLSLPQTSYSGCAAGWNDSNKTISFFCTDVSSGCQNIFRRMDNNAFVDSNTLSIIDDGNHIVDYYSVDFSGNTELQKTFSCAIDTHAPSFDSIQNAGIYFTQDFNVIFKQLDFSVSGYAQAIYRLNNGAWQNLVTNDGIDYYALVGVDGNNKLDYNFIDAAGHNTSGTVYALIDRQGPNFFDANWFNPVNDYNFNAPNFDLNGVVSGDELLLTDVNNVLISFDNGSTFIDANAVDDGNGLFSWNYQYTHGLTQSQDINIIVFAKDNLDNNSQRITRRVHYDITAPSITATTIIDYTSVTINALLSEESSCRISDANVAYSLASNTKNGTSISWDLNELTDGTAYTRYVICLDHVNNSAIKKVTFTTRDFAPEQVRNPTTQLPPDENNNIDNNQNNQNNQKNDNDIVPVENNTAIDNNAKSLDTPINNLDNPLTTALDSLSNLGILVFSEACMFEPINLLGVYCLPKAIIIVILIFGLIGAGLFFKKKRHGKLFP